jgi:hypothetical protein
MEKTYRSLTAMSLTELVKVNKELSNSDTISSDQGRKSLFNIILSLQLA